MTVSFWCDRTYQEHSVTVIAMAAHFLLSPLCRTLSVAEVARDEQAWRGVLQDPVGGNRGACADEFFRFVSISSKFAESHATVGADGPREPSRTSRVCRSSQSGKNPIFARQALSPAEDKTPSSLILCRERHGKAWCCPHPDLGHRHSLHHGTKTDRTNPSTLCLNIS